MEMATRKEKARHVIILLVWEVFAILVTLSVFYLVLAVLNVDEPQYRMITTSPDLMNNFFYSLTALLIVSGILAIYGTHKNGYYDSSRGYQRWWHKEKYDLYLPVTIGAKVIVIMVAVAYLVNAADDRVDKVIYVRDFTTLVGGISMLTATLLYTLFVVGHVLYPSIHYLLVGSIEKSYMHLDADGYHTTKNDSPPPAAGTSYFYVPHGGIFRRPRFVDGSGANNSRLLDWKIQRHWLSGNNFFIVERATGSRFRVGDLRPWHFELFSCDDLDYYLHCLHVRAKWAERHSKIETQIGVFLAEALLLLREVPKTRLARKAIFEALKRLSGDVTTKEEYDFHLATWRRTMASTMIDSIFGTS